MKGNEVSGGGEGEKESKNVAHEAKRKWNEFKWEGEEEVQIKIHERESEMMRLKWKVLNVFTAYVKSILNRSNT